jgi:hypothetical protein
MHDSKFSKKRLIGLLLIGIVAFFALDVLIFRSGLYSRRLSPVSMSGYGYYVDYYEKRRPADPSRDVLFTGDSRMSEGFWAYLANQSDKAKDIHFVQGAIPGASLRVWYYLLRDMDPHADRYRAIVISVPSYRLVSPPEPSFDNSMLDMDFLSLVLGFRELTHFAGTYTDSTAKLQAWPRVFVAALNYRMDLQDYLLHPKLRKIAVRWRQNINFTIGDDYKGHEESMDGLSIDLRSHSLTFPARLTDNEKQLVIHRFLTPYNFPTDAFDAYTQEWLTKICALYAHSHTQIVIARMPTSPLPEAFDEKDKPMAHFVAAVGRLPNVKFIPEETFLNLENPHDFFDTNHLNAIGRIQFTHEMVDVLPTILASNAHEGTLEQRSDTVATQTRGASTN